MPRLCGKENKDDMSKTKIGRKEFKDKVLACWIGKNIGGTLGTPWECKTFVNALEFYEPLPTTAAPNDDLDLQLVWLKLMEEVGTDPSVRELAEIWQRCAPSYPWNEYGFFMRNMSRGLVPPVAGCFENYFVDEMGSPIRSEIWACLHPGDPQAAARMAWKDSALDHAGGEGTYGEMFWAAVEAAAFVENDPMTLIQIGLNMIPLSSHIARVIREAIWCHQNGLNWGAARDRIVSRFGHIQPCNAIPNHGFEIMGWLYGKDFGDCLLKAVNCGYDTDCTGATLGSVLGIIGGTKGIPAKWRKPVGDDIVLHKYTGVCDAPKTVQELTERTVVLAEKAMKGKSEVAFADKTSLPGDLLTRLFRNELARESLQQDPMCAIELAGGREICFHYNGEPVLRPGIGKVVRVSLPGQKPVKVDLSVPKGWACQRLGDETFLLVSRGAVADRNQVKVTVEGRSAVFTILGPNEAKGFAAGSNVPQCPKCWARVEACVCPRPA